MRWTLAFVPIVFSACSHGDTKALEQRVATLEAQMAALDAKATPGGASCTQMFDTSVPAGTVFGDPLAFDVGATDFAPGDAITITEVKGTRKAFEVGGVYLVRGEYVLASADRSEIAFTITTPRPGECTRGDRRNVATVARGSGKFEVASSMPYAGFPHLYFTRPGGHRGAYFGKDAFLQR